MKPSIATYRRSFEQDPELTIDCRSFKPSDCSSLEIVNRFGKDNLDIARILVEDGYQTIPVTPARRVSGKICAVCLKSSPMQGMPCKLLHEHKSVVLRPRHKAACNGAHYRRIKTVRASMQVDSNTTQRRHLQTEISRP